MTTKINFTKEHQVKLWNMACNALFNKTIFTASMGGTMNIFDLLHTTTVNTLVNMKQSLDKQIAAKESADEWSMTDLEQTKLKELKDKSQLINLIIGYKKYQTYLADVEAERQKLNKELEDLKESQKTPEDKIKELEDKLKALDE